MSIPYFPLAAWHTPSNVHPETDPRQRLNEFIEEFEQRLASLTWGQPFPTILLAETDPLRYIAGFLVAVHHHCPVILANPHWGDWEWQQVYQQVHPHLCFADSLFNLPPFPSTSQLPSSLILIPTGGTSGQMRFVQHTWKTLMASIQGFQKHFQIDIIHSCCLLPLYHVSGLMQFLRSYVSGGQLIIMPFKSLTPDSLKFLPDATDFFISLVPTQLQRCYQSPDLSEWLSQGQMVLLGGAPVWDQLLQESRRKGIRVALTYGMTETASQVTALKPEEFSQGRTGCGRPLPHAKVKILDEGGKELSAFEVGQVVIQSRSLGWGYYPDQPFGVDWVTDDLGFLDHHGYLTIVGRNSHKIISGGENVYPEEIEAVIRACPTVMNRLIDVCVVGVPDWEWGEVVTALVVVREDISTGELRDGIAPFLSSYKRPKFWLKCTQLPRNTQDKINRPLAQEIALLELTRQGKSGQP